MTTTQSWLLRLLGGRAGVLALVLFLFVTFLWAYSVRVALSTIEANAKVIAKLQIDLSTEKELRQSDITGLTTLIDGLVEVQAKENLDQGALEHAIEQASPAGLSPFMRAFFECLRAQRASGKSCTPGSIDPGSGAGAR